jgi:hypothetical protein
MQPLYKVGESTAFGFVPSGFIVVSDELFQREDGGYTERMVDSGDNYTSMDRGPEVDVSYHPVPHGPRHGGVLVAYTNVKPSVKLALPDGEYVDVSGSDFDYWRVMSDYWEPTYDLRVCEQDVVWRPDVLEAFARCPEPWCVFAYDDYHSPEDAEAWANMLGCTRFRKELIAAVPNAVSNVEERFRDWHYLCDGLGRNLREAGYTHHWHSPPVHHDHS